MSELSRTARDTLDHGGHLSDRCGRKLCDEIKALEERVKELESDHDDWLAVVDDGRKTLRDDLAKLKAVADAAVKTWHVLNTYADDYWPLLPVMAWLEPPLRTAGILKEGE